MKKDQLKKECYCHCHMQIKELTAQTHTTQCVRTCEHCSKPTNTRVYSHEKCDICGSTAIDHTEIQCQLNRQFKRKGGI